MSDKYGILILNQGYTLDDIQDPRSWSMNSNYPMLKVATKGSGTLNGSPAEGIINHDLGYNPLSLVFSESLGVANEFRRVCGDIPSGQGYIENNPGDPNNMYFRKEAAIDDDYFYYIFYDETLS